MDRFSRRAVGWSVAGIPAWVIFHQQCLKDWRREKSVDNIGARPDANIVQLKCGVSIKKQL